MSNQFDRRMTAEAADHYMALGARREDIRGYVEQIKAKPNLCLLPASGDGYVFMRVAGKLNKYSVKSLIYYVMEGRVPAFKPCPCKNAGCINPYHQAVRVEKA